MRYTTDPPQADQWTFGHLRKTEPNPEMSNAAAKTIITDRTELLSFISAQVSSGNASIAILTSLSDVGRDNLRIAIEDAFGHTVYAMFGLTVGALEDVRDNHNRRPYVFVLTHDYSEHLLAMAPNLISVSYTGSL